MLLYQRLRYLFISVLCVLNYSIYTLAQHRGALKDLPTCAIPCMNQAAFAVGCKGTDISCLCANQIPDSTILCSSSVCNPPSQASAEKVLSNMCNTDDITISSTSFFSTFPSISSSTSQSSQISTTTNSIPTPTSETSSTSTTSSSTSTFSFPIFTVLSSTSTVPFFTTDSSSTPTDSSTTPTDSSSTPSDSSTTPSDSSTTPTDSSTTPTDSSSTSTASSTTSTDSSMTPNIVTFPTELASSTSTSFIVTTIFTPPTSLPTSGAGTSNPSISTRALLFGFPFLLLLVTAI